MSLRQQIDDFFACERFAVVGASASRRKYGNMVLRMFQQQNRSVVPVNPNAVEVEGLRAVGTLNEIEPPPEAICIITPPDVTELIIDDALQLNIRHIWMQPGAESSTAEQQCRDAGISLISGGPCILVVGGFRNT